MHAPVPPRQTPARGAPERPRDVLVVGAGPAGVAAALRAADLGAKTTLVTRDEFGGMAANDGPIPVRTLAHAARLLRDARQLERYGIAVGALALDYPRLLGRVREVVAEARSRAAYREQIDAAGPSSTSGRVRHGSSIRTRSRRTAVSSCAPTRS